MNFSKSVTGFLWYFVKQQPIAFIYVTVAALIWAINEVLFPYFIKLIVNGISNYNGDPLQVYTVLWTPVILMMSFWLLMEFSMRTQSLVSMEMFPRLRNNIREKIFKYVSKHSHEYFSSHFAGNIANKINDLPRSSHTICEMLINFISFGILFLFTLILLWHTNYLFSIVVLGWLIIHLSLVVIYFKKANKLSEIHSESVSILNGKIVDVFTNMLNVRTFAHAKYEEKYLKKYLKDEMKKSKASVWHLEKMRFFQGIAGILFIFSMVLLLIYSWSHNQATLGDFTLVSMLSFNILGFLWYISFQTIVLVREAGTIKAALSLISVEHEIKDLSDASELKISQGEIQFNNVSFSYRGVNTVFENLSLIIPAGQKVGLVGFSGAGKSTFVNLILRFFDINAGQIILDQQNIANVTRDSLRQQISMIPQDPSLFHRTLMENIRYGRLDATDEDVIAAAKLAHCHEFIIQLAESYDALVGERGIKLSGGQRQRIAIARAILKNAPILILDEATSSLDSITERLIQESLVTLMKNRTTIVIAHRLSTLSEMDRILVFRDGRIIEDGTIPELLDNNDHFSKLWKMQSDGFLPD